MLRIGTNHVKFSFTLDCLALIANLFYRRSYFHCFYNLLVILPLVKSYGLISTKTLSPGISLI